MKYSGRYKMQHDDKAFSWLELIFKDLQKFGWYPLYSSWEAGYLVLGGFIGSYHPEAETVEDTDFGIIYISRDYMAGEWDYNKWGIEFIKCSSLCSQELRYLTRGIEELEQMTNKEYPKNGSVTDEIANKRKEIDDLIKKCKED